MPATVSGVPVEVWRRTAAGAKDAANSDGWGWHAGCFIRRIMSRDASLKVSETEAPSRERKPRENFQEVLKAVPKPAQTPAPKGAVAGRFPVPAQVLLARPAKAAGGAAALGSVESLQKARVGMNAEVQRLGQVRQASHTQHEQRVEGRLLELIVRELSIEFSNHAERHGAPAAAITELRPTAPPAGAATGHGHEGAGGQAPGKVEGAGGQAALRVRAAVALVERIETFVKSQRPAIALTVSGGIDARVEVERTGPNEVALKVKGTRGPPAPEDLARIREEMRERGLKLSSMSVG